MDRFFSDFMDSINVNMERSMDFWIDKWKFNGILDNFIEFFGKITGY